MKLKGQMLGLMAMVMVSGYALGVEAASALDWERCAAIKQDMERLACYDTIVAGMKPRVSSDVSHDERNAVISRCRAQMGEYGSAMVKACVDQDMAAYEALQTYPDDRASFIDRCAKQMGKYGWSMVKACADQDIEAERALAN